MAPAGDAERSIGLGLNAGLPETSKYVSNQVITSKYTWLTFVPKNIWEQLHKFGNVYFLVISIIMYLGEKTPLFVGTIKAFSTLGLLMMMMSITAAMSLFDDLQRKKADAEINSTSAQVVSSKRDPIDRSKRWDQVAVGDIVIVRKDEEFPADVVPLYCSGEGGNCYVSTANLDGETNLKLKAAPAATQSVLGPPSSQQQADWDPLPHLSELSGSILAEAPNSNIHDFNGSLKVGGKAPESLGSKQLLMRGTVLRNTTLCIGVVCYTGADTRMIRNSRPAHLKQSNLEIITNAAMLIILAVQAVFAFASAVLHCQFTPLLKEHWYLFPTDIILPEMLGWWLTFFTLYSNLMPISLYPTVEFCNAFQCYFIRNDKHMYYKKQFFNNGVGYPAVARSSNLCQELGQVGYIFSDKTGTLTQNDMELKRVAIANIKYGTFEQGGEDGFNGGHELQAARGGMHGPSVDAFLEVLAVAHTVMITTGKDGRPQYEAESPDEFALVSSAAEQGWAFRGRRGRDVCVDMTAPGSATRQLTYTVLATNEFNSTRKRMSVVVQKGEEFLLFVKGADNVMLDRAANKHPQLEKDLKEFSIQGLRTLVIGYRRLSLPEVQNWQARYDVAMRETKNREQKLADVAEDIEVSLDILGTTAIEDKLQEGVPETIEKIRAAGIKLWVLTGDKLETARNIGFSTKVLTPSMDLRIIDEEEGTMNLDELQRDWDFDDPGRKALMISGKALQVFMESDETKEQLLDIAQGSSVLIACRVSPAQKAQMVRLVREGISPQPVTLSVGDGANDVPMIQEAQVGVGIAGKEGRQAVNNSDFAIAQFKYLQRLLLVHGRWNYRRACTFTLFTFWRNMVQVLMMMYYTMMSGFSGTALYEDWIRLSFNVLCTLPILAAGCMDQDVPARVALKNPELYEIGRQGTDLNTRKTLYTIGSAILHSLVLFWVAIPAFPGLEIHGTGDYYSFGTICYTCLLIDVNYRAIFCSNSHNKYTIGAVIMSFAMYIFWLVFYPMNKLLADILSPNMYMVPAHMVGTLYFWFSVIATPLIAMMLDVFMSFCFHHYWPDMKDQVAVTPRGLGQTEFSEEEEWLAHNSDQESDSGSAEGMLESKVGSVDLTPFGQQAVPMFRFADHLRPHFKVVAAGVFAGFTLLLIGGLCLYHSHQYKQVRIEYARNNKTIGAFVDPNQLWLHRPIGTLDSEIRTLDCKPNEDGSERVCKVTVVFPEGMRKPLLMYTVGPVFQNYNAYMRSEVAKEVMGNEVPEGLRKTMCQQPQTRVWNVSGTEVPIVPCGMKTISFFNDTFEVVGRRIDVKNIAWDSDVERYNNPPDYGSPGKEWLYQMFPGVIDQTLGVKDEAFVSWMRPSAVPRVWNRYGYMEDSYAPGENLTLVIHSRWPLHNISDGFKELVITEYGVFGGRHDLFGYVVTIAGIVSFLLAGAAVAMEWFRPLQYMTDFGQMTDFGHDEVSESCSDKE